MEGVLPPLKERQRITKEEVRAAMKSGKTAGPDDIALPVTLPFLGLASASGDGGWACSLT